MLNCFADSLRRIEAMKACERTTELQIQTVQIGTRFSATFCSYWTTMINRGTSFLWKKLFFALGWNMVSKCLLSFLFSFAGQPTPSWLIPWDLGSQIALFNHCENSSCPVDLSLAISSFNWISLTRRYENQLKDKWNLQHDFQTALSN